MVWDFAMLFDVLLSISSLVGLARLGALSSAW